MTALQPVPEGLRLAEANGGDVLRVKEQRVRTTTVTWQGRTDLSREEWEKAGLKLGGVSRSTSWWVGDWVRFGQHHYRGDNYGFASRVTGYDEKTLRNFAYVAGRYDQRRRRDTLTWSHHAELARLTPDDQDRWLNEAEALKLTVTALRGRVRHEEQAAAAANAREASVDTDAQGDADAADGASPLLCPDCRAPLVLVGGALRRVPISGQTENDDAHEHQRPR